MNRLALTAAAALLGVAGVAGNAEAVPIAAGSELSINGSDTFTGTVGGTTFTLNFVGLGNVGGSSGDFTTVANCTACVTMITQLTQASTNFQLYSVTSGAVTSSLTAGNITSFSITAGAGGLESLAISGAGTLNLTGRDPTSGFYDLTTQGPSGIAQVTFSNTAIAAAPEPASLVLIGTALGFFGLIRLCGPRRREHAGGLAA